MKPAFGLKPIKDPRFVLIFASIVLALLATFLFRTYLQVATVRATGGGEVEVLVAATDVMVGSTLKASDFTQRRVPEAHVSTREVRAEYANFLEGQRVDENVPKGQQFWTDIAFADRASLAALVPVNQRAVALSVDSLNSFNGMIEPGNRIDIYSVARGEGLTGDASFAAVLQNVRVLAVGDQTRPSSRLAPAPSTEGASASASNVTLVLSPEEIGKLALAEAEGRLVVVLRNPSDIFVEKQTSPPAAATGTRENILEKAVEGFPTIFVGGEKERSGFYPGAAALNQQLREMDPAALKQTLLDIMQGNTPVREDASRKDEPKEP